MVGVRCTVADDTVMLENKWLRRSFRLREGCTTTGFDIRPTGSGAWLPVFHFAGSSPMEAEVQINTGLAIPSAYSSLDHHRGLHLPPNLTIYFQYRKQTRCLDCRHDGRWPPAEPAR